MSVVYEAVVFEADAAAARAAVDRLETFLSLRLFQPADRGFVLVCWRPGAATRHATREVERVTAELSRASGCALAVHHDDRCRMAVATLYRAGARVRQFGPAGEVLAPTTAGLEAAGFAGWMTAADLRGWACADERWVAERADWPSEAATILANGPA